MNIRLLRIFQVVAEEESITQAAEKLYISQPAVSNAIKQLEDHLGVTLFDRLSRRLYLNETGRLFLNKVRQLLEIYHELETEAAQLEDKAPIKIGSSITIANFILPRAIRLFQADQPDIDVFVQVENARQIESQLLQHQIDLGLIEGVIQHDELITRTLSSYDLSIVCSPEHPMGERDKIELDELIKQPFLLREKGSAIRNVFDSALLLHGFQVTPLWTSINSQALIQATKQGLGLSVLPTILVQESLKQGELHALSVPGLQLINQNLLVQHKDKLQSPSTLRLIEEIVRVAST